MLTTDQKSYIRSEAVKVSAPHKRGFVRWMVRILIFSSCREY